MIDSFLENPKKLLLLDCIGALVSAFMLGVVLVRLESYFGIPVKTLYFLAFLPCLFALFDYYSWRSENINHSHSLKVIAFVNIIYCCLSLGLAIYHNQELTLLGWGYIIIEIFLVLLIAMIELRTATRL